MHDNEPVPFVKEMARMPDGVQLATFHYGNRDNPPLLLSNAFSVSVEMWEPIARVLAPHFFLVTFETRGHPSLVDDFDPQRCGLSAHVDDVRGTLDHYGIDKAHMVGWCSGAQVALAFAARHQARVHSLALISGMFLLPHEVPQSDYFRKLTAILGQVSKSRGRAALYCTMNAENDSDGLMADVDPRVRELAGAPYREPEALYRFANMGMRLMEESPVVPGEDFDVPVLMLVGDADWNVVPETSVAMARLLKDAPLLHFDGGDHYILYTEPRVARALQDFFQQAAGRGA